MQFESSWRLWTAETVNATAAITSPVLDLRWSDRTSYVVFLKAVPSSGTADVKIEVALSADGTNFDNFLTSLTASSNTQFSATPHDYHTYPLDAQGMPYCKIKVTGVGSNPATTAVTATLSFIEALPSDAVVGMISRAWDDVS